MGKRSTREARMDPPCTTCGKPEWVHNESPQGHAYASPMDVSGPPSGPSMAMPFDPVLRQALIDKGVLTADDLREAEKKILEQSVVFGQAFTSGGNHGSSGS